MGELLSQPGQDIIRTHIDSLRPVPVASQPALVEEKTNEDVKERKRKVSTLFESSDKANANAPTAKTPMDVDDAKEERKDRGLRPQN